MTTIHKFPLPIGGVATVLLPAGATVIHAGIQHGIVCLWAVVDTEKAMVERIFYIFGTGHPAPLLESRGRDSILDRHVGTFQDGHFVWHIFE